ncbi:MAG: helix-turn-helix domain-containing protein [Candidatus Ornithomonoglobus sp.]
MLTFYEIRRQSYSVKNNLEEVIFGTHIHSDIEILYMRSGTQHIIVENKPYSVNEGEAAVIFPNVNHSYLRETKEPLPVDAVLIICSEKVYRPFFSDLSNVIPENPIVEKEKIPPDVKYAFNAIDKNANPDIRLAWIVIILSNLLPRLTLTHKKPFPIEDISYKIVKYIEENFTEPMTLDTVAAALSISRSYVSRIFSEKIKMNFRKYLGALRAEYAAKLIRTTQDSLTVISENSGFESQSTFNRVFRDIYGITPREFRNNMEKYYKL